MIKYESFQLDNGLKVLVHRDKTTPMVVVNTIYNVGARDEDENRTGFAHLFEHLMFGGSKNIENFDAPLQMAGGECNAFTNNDITNYYNTLPVENIETALWLESDRMLELAFTDKSLEVQRNVVIEEFKQRYLNQPYGDVWLLLRPLIYQKHPYKWPTIGKKMEHIEEACMQDVKDFFYQYYSPNNATLVIGGNVETESVKSLVQKWYGNIPSRPRKDRALEAEPDQTEERRLSVDRDVPSDALYMAFRMGSRTSDEHYVGDLMSDLLGRGKSSRFYTVLVEEKKLLSSVSAYITAGWEDGLFVISGHLNRGVEPSQAEQVIWEILEEVKTTIIEERELEKVKNKFKTAKVFSEQSLMNRVMNIAMFDMMGKLDQINDELERYDEVSANDVMEFAANRLVKTNVSVLTIIAKR